MDQLYDTVKQTLDGLVIPPLQNIISQFLPDRGILEIEFPPDAATVMIVVISKPTGIAIWMTIDRKQWYKIANYSPASFTCSNPNFDTFVVHFNESLKGRKRITVVYQGEIEVIEIQ